MKRDWRYKVCVLGVILIFCLPMAGMILFNKSEVLSGENRKSASFPRFDLHGQSNPYASIDQYIQRVNSYYSDHLGFRSELLSLYRFCKVSLFGGILYPEKAVRGTDNWYFLGDSFNNVIKESKGIIYFSETQLDTIEKNLLTIDKECRERGIKLYVAIAPNKLSVYGKYLPILQFDHPTKPEQLISRMKRDRIPVIDLKKDFSHYSDRRLFHRNDTHWNSFGAFIGYRTLMDVIAEDFPQVRPLSLNDYELDTIVSSDGDLTPMLSLTIPEERVVMKPLFESRTDKKIIKIPLPDYYTGNPDDFAIRYTNPARPLKALVYRDSFFTVMAPFIKETFGESVMIWHPFGRSLMESEKPDLIIYEIVERNIDDLVKIRQFNIHL